MATFETSPTNQRSEKDTTNFWMEWGHGRTRIAPRIRKATSRLVLFSSLTQPIAGAKAIPFPVASSPEAIERINTSIEENNIDIIWPQTSAKYDLSTINAEVHTAASPDIINLVDDKVAFNTWLGDDQYRPLSVEAEGVEAISTAFQRLNSEGHDVAIKPVIGVASDGYWHLTEDTPVSFLNKPEKRTIHPDIYLDAMALEEAKNGPQRMVLMDYLPGPEVSVDLLTWNGEPLIHSARTKVDFASSQRVQSEHEVLEHTHYIAKKLGFHGIISLQYRLDTEGNWKMLEINPRPAGGASISEDAGFGIITNWAQLLTREIEAKDVKRHHADVTLNMRPSWTNDELNK